jgi:hypothetical protein
LGEYAGKRDIDLEVDMWNSHASVPVDPERAEFPVAPTGSTYRTTQFHEADDGVERRENAWVALALT